MKEAKGALALGAMIAIGVVCLAAAGALLGLGIEAFEFGWNIVR